MVGAAVGYETEIMLLVGFFTGLEQGLLYTTLGIFGAATFVAIRVATGKRLGRGLRPMLMAGMIALTALIVVLTVRTGHLPVASRAGVLLLAAWCVGIATTLLDLRLRREILLLVTAPTMAILLVFTLLLVLRPVAQGSGTMHPGVIVHIVLAILGVAAFTFAAGVGAYYLWQIRQLKRNPKLALAQRVPPLEFLDRLNFGAAAIGFPLLALSVLGVWLFSSRMLENMSGWMRDPTVVVTLGGLAIYVVLFAARGFAGWRGRRIAWLSVAGFVIIVVGLVVAAYCTSTGVMHTS